jgi:hypothetical protein
VTHAEPPRDGDAGRLVEVGGHTPFTRAIVVSIDRPRCPG